MDKKYMIALDQGTTSSRAVIFNHNQEIVRIAQREYTSITRMKAGWSMTRWRFTRPSMAY